MFSASRSWPLAERTQPCLDKITVTGSEVSRSRSDNAFASPRCTIGDLRSSPKASASVFSSRLIKVLRRALEPKINCSSSRSLANSSCSALIRISSSLAKWRSFKSKIASAWRSDKAKRSINTGFGLSSSRMIAITSSIFRKAINKPSKRCNRSNTLSKRCCKRLRTVSIRNANHSVKIVRKPFTCGNPLVPIRLRLTR